MQELDKAKAEVERLRHAQRQAERNAMPAADRQAAELRNGTSSATAWSQGAPPLKRNFDNSEMVGAVPRSTRVAAAAEEAASSSTLGHGRVSYSVGEMLERHLAAKVSSLPEVREAAGTAPAQERASKRADSTQGEDDTSLAGKRACTREAAAPSRSQTLPATDASGGAVSYRSRRELIQSFLPAGAWRSPQRGCGL